MTAATAAAKPRYEDAGSRIGIGSMTPNELLEAFLD